MASKQDQIYSATYSNVPVFEFVTDEGPIMRRKADAWINATHILKIAKFPKARRTRILEKDVQTGIHEKVQGGYGKYQGTYVPLELGAEIAKTFGVYDVLRPIFDFQYIEGRSETPPPAPKHNHASASNVARRQLQQKNKQDSQIAGNGPSSAKREWPADGVANGREERENSRPKRVALTGRGKPNLNESKTVPIDSAGPGVGTFSSRNQSSFSHPQSKLPPLTRQDTERDALSIMASNMNVRREDLENDTSDEESKGGIRARRLNSDFGAARESEDEEFMSSKELFGSRAFGASHRSFGKVSPQRTSSQRQTYPENPPRMLSLNGSLGPEHSNLQYHHYSQSHPANSLTERNSESNEYFNTLLNYFLDDNNQGVVSSKFKSGTLGLPDNILNPPQPLHKINIDRPIDNEGNTIFHWACSMANVGMIEFLLSIFSNFINSEKKNYQGETPLMFLVQFNNSYQSQNFQVMLDLLFDSVLSVDKSGRTVLHHIALACDSSRPSSFVRSTNDINSKNKKEKFAKYYFDVIFSKIMEFPDYQLSHGDQGRSVEDKKELISRFINHQDNDGNTAFHIIAHNLSKRCIKTFISYHKFIDFSLRNAVNFTVEDYLASHNYVLRLEKDESQTNDIDGPDTGSPSLYALDDTKSFESQALKTKSAISFQSAASNLITEKLGELGYAVEKELRELDEKYFSLLKYLRIIGLDRFKSQKLILQLFDLDYLIGETADESEVSADQEDGKSFEIYSQDNSKDKVVQEEIGRLKNDSCFQLLTMREKLSKVLERYEYLMEKRARATLTELAETSDSKEPEASNDEAFAMAVKLQQLILERQKTAHKIYDMESKVPYIPPQSEEFKENLQASPDNEKPVAETPELMANEKTLEKAVMTIADLPHNDKLYKYCKLIALSCGMSFEEVENSIDLIELSLTRAGNGQ